jgi:tRNA dimethylallyltransferase
LPAFSAIGYREAWGVIDGQATVEEAIGADAARNVAFAKRQRTWFRSEPDVEWLDATDQAAAGDRAMERARTLAGSGPARPRH